jgi:hypothetical protein
MTGLGVVRMISHVGVRLAVRPGSGGQPTARWQDKSRGVRLGRSAGERGTDQRLVHEVHSPTQPACFENPLKFSTLHTSHRSSHDW